MVNKKAYFYLKLFFRYCEYLIDYKKSVFSFNAL
jgi:hypothetical protein